MEEPDLIAQEELNVNRVDKALADKHRVSANVAPYDPPELDFTEEEFDEFIRKVTFGESWSETFVRNLVTITLRTRSRRETEFGNMLVENEVRAETIRSQNALADRLNKVNIVMSAVNYGGTNMPAYVIPPRPWTDEHLKSFSEFIEKHPLADVPDPLHFILLAILVQFQDKCYRMQKRVIENAEKPDFSGPGAVS